MSDQVCHMYVLVYGYQEPLSHLLIIPGFRMMNDVVASAPEADRYQVKVTLILAAEGFHRYFRRGWCVGIYEIISLSLAGKIYRFGNTISAKG